MKDVWDGRNSPGAMRYQDGKLQMLDTDYVWKFLSDIKPKQHHLIIEALKKLDIKQRQDSTYEQLLDVITYANLAGCYDAADLIRSILTKE